MSKLKKFVSLLILPLAMVVAATSALVAPAAFAADDEICSNDNVSDAIKAASGCSNSGDLPELPDVITSILNGIIAVVGFVAVAFIVYGGVIYMTSSGDSSKTQKAKSTIFYALIGLAICALSFMIVNFVIANIIGGGATGGGNGGDGGVGLVGDGESGLPDYVSSIINGVIAVLGFVCVGFTIYGGVQYMSSAGDSAKTQKAKNTILYSLIGLAICVLAFAIVNFVILNIIGGGNGGGNAMLLRKPKIAS